MKLTQILKDVVWLLVTEGRVSYRRLKLEFDLDDDSLEEIRFELIRAKRLAADHDGQFLHWSPPSGTASPPAALRANDELPRLTLGAGGRARSERAETAHQGPAGTPAALAVEPILPGAERRHLTVMFCDLVGSTALSTLLDPEDLQDVFRAYQDAATRIIQEFGGFVAKYMGDGILVYFGYPRAHEKDAERAVRSGLAIAQAMPKLNAEMGSAKNVEFAIRVGIATGLVVVGQVIGEGSAEESTVVGETPNIAARLQGLARPNGVVISPVTRDLVGESFLCEDLGLHTLKGIAAPVQAWGVVGLTEEKEEEATYDPSAAVGPPVLVGRDEEIGLLRRAWQQTKEERRGQVVLLSGEPGIGKTALVDTLRAQVRAEGLSRVAFRCSPYHTNSALYPVIEHIRRLVKWQSDDSPSIRLGKLEAMLHDCSLPLAEVVPLFASLLSLSVPEERYPPVNLSPQRLKQQTQDALIAWTLEEAERQPMLQVWEDIHWADPSTLELLGLLIDQAPTVSLLIVLTFRPDFALPSPTRSHMTPITLNRLERPQTEVLVRQLAGGKTIPAGVIEHIVAKTDGVPLYIEELTKSILASGVLRDEGDRYALTGPLSAVAIPATLQETLMARLDRLPTVREVAQLGAVLGREFGYEMLHSIAAVEESILQDGLGRLVEDELLYQRGRPPRARYIFKHALVQDAAYQSLLKRSRQQYHRQVAELIEAKFPETVETHPELVAHHYTEAQCFEQAVKYWHAAGRRAAQRSANAEAVAHLKKGLEELSHLPHTRERDRQELMVLTTLGPVLIAAKGYGAADVKDTYARAKELCDQVGDRSDLFPVLRGFWNSTLFAGDMIVARQRGDELLSLAREMGDAALLVEAHRVGATVAFFMGEFSDGRAHMEQGIALYDPERHRQLALVYGADPAVVCRLYGALSLWMLGYPQQAQSVMGHAAAATRELSHGHTEAFTLSYVAWHHHLRREPNAVREHADAVIAVASKHGIAQWLNWGMILRGWTLAMHGQWEEGMKQLRDGFEAWRAMQPLFVPYLLGLLAEALATGKHAEEALGALNESLDMVARGKQGFYAAELHRLKGHVLLQRAAADAAQQAEGCFRDAIEVARRQKARSLELRAATSLARLWQQQDKQANARDLLAPVHAWFTEGFDTRDIIEARQLLEDLRS